MRIKTIDARNGQSSVLPIFVILYILVQAACTQAPRTKMDTVNIYYEGLNASDFEQVKSVVADSFVISSGDYKTLYLEESHYTFFKWDSVFSPTYNIQQVEEVGELLKATVLSKSLRYAFLKHNPLTCEMTFSFKADTISKLDVGECMDAEWDIWEAQRDSLVAWIDNHHPELTGFVHDLTQKGAENYIIAIELYERSMIKNELSNN